MMIITVQDLVLDPDDGLLGRVGNVLHGQLLLVNGGQPGHGFFPDLELLVQGPLFDKVQQLFALGYDVEVLLRRGDNGHDDFVPHVLLGVMLPEFEGVHDVVDQLGVIEEEMHRVLDALDADGQADVVVASQEGQPQVAVVSSQVGTTL